MVPKMRVANMPTCHKRSNNQKGSSMAGPFGQRAKFSCMEAKKACERPVPFVSGMVVGIDEGSTQPKKASAITIGFNSKSMPSEISNSMRGVRVVRAGAAVTRRATGRVTKAVRFREHARVEKVDETVSGAAEMKAIAKSPACGQRGRSAGGCGGGGLGAGRRRGVLGVFKQEPWSFAKRRAGGKYLPRARAARASVRAEGAVPNG